MKKRIILEDLTKSGNSYLREYIAPLKRNALYIIDWHGEEMLVKVTHFYKTGLRIKPLSAPLRFRKKDNPSTIKYEHLFSHNFREASIEDAPLFMRDATKFFREPFEQGE